ncbi:glycosyltransferase [Haloferax sp. MBLA0076]|uniref:Glycosyltransferase n=1 Tax=Haloferax litoreum TaxID=2666140 RepID=A0A6A8GLK2_9EURY|nr:MULTISPECIES: glycosyltransferase family 2 protein [Haloferax]KAB1189940.1 glycosyltransferase family 2 protein [Haloferax sp. CBA1148]MRX23711.1 glycosyltransferase [Haloferax litoreum]
MYHGKTVGVVVPAYNEERLVGAVIDTIPALVDRTYVVDDHSSDGTWEEIKTHAARANNRAANAYTEDGVKLISADGGVSPEMRVVPIRHPANRGRGAAVKTGYRHALEDDIDIIVVMDGDGQMDPDILTHIIDPVVYGTADYAVGDRLAGPLYWRGMPPWRLFGNGLLSGLTRIASGYWHIRDPQNGYTAISAETLEDLDFDRLYDQYGFLNDLLVKLNVAGKRVATVPMYARYGDEESGIRYSSFVPGLSYLLLKNFLWRLRAKYLSGRAHPAAILYILGAVSVFLSVFRPDRKQTSQAPYGPISKIAVGVASLVGAMLLDKRSNEHLRIELDVPDSFKTERDNAEADAQEQG